MPRSCVIALAMLLALPALASAQTTATSGSDPASSVESTGASGTTPAVPSSEDTSPSGTELAPEQSTVAGDVSMSGDVPLSTVAQEPEPGAEPQLPTSGEGPAAGGGLPQTALEAVKLALLGLVLALVGARIRVVVKRRRALARLAPDGLPYGSPDVSEVPATAEAEDVEYDDEQPEHDDDTREYARAEVSSGGRDEWTFPDPDKPAPSGLLPSTARARREARRREDERLG